MKKLWIVLAFLLLVGCGSKDQCPACSQEVNFTKDVFCSNCGMTFTGIKPDGYEQATNNTHLGTWKFLIPNDDYSGDYYDVAVELLLTLSADGTYDLEFGSLILNKSSVSYQEILAEYGSEGAAEEAAKRDTIALSEELAPRKYNLVHSENSLQQEFEDAYYDQASDELLFTWDAGFVLSGTRE